MPESPAQRAARERNLRKGNPRSYGARSAEDNGEKPSSAAEGAPRAAEGETFKARPRGPAKAPRKQRASPRSSEGGASQAPRAAESANSGGFFGGLLDGLR
jgi:hypothetical protein